MELTVEQKKAVNKLIAAKKSLEKSGLKFILADESLHLYPMDAKVNFDSINDIDYYCVINFGKIPSYGM